MATGLIALLDDVIAIAKVAAASIDDVGTQAVKASSKAAGVVIDDAAVTPRYVVGFAADRELPIVGKIAMGSLRNKLLILLPVAMLLSAFAPWAITPLLMAGGLFLCYEGAEKLLEAVFPRAAHEHEEDVGLDQQDPKHLEDQKVAGAIRTDFILSAEIMAIALATIPDAGFLSRLLSLIIVALAMTAGVYGAVALIVKADDMGVAMARNSMRVVSALGHGLVAAMPVVLRVLAVVGTIAMLWVGGGIVVHGLESYGAGAVAHLIQDAATAVSAGGAIIDWLVNTLLTSVFAVIVGALLIPVVGKVIAPLWKKLAPG
jgi:predicted DNA repair protein MutK